ncbi:MarR family winged helix-turn-helix transcriptional regulator [Nonomuraea sp. NEAU-A123]|uniref:MarR family winged helix-turn-helix transcriptional regulator n=1 Tax=Nonomuraea sp. NEAU-A123 TaxID=2839649 RepID=UPI001BE3EB6D|nr:MarR family winged helix-turn-helix transcriptional regulator [Nonomuraea sp. NEAU-A123]MBT2231654.1 MarR family winged helix-turn-helix transcriptional regulator [Nonomuraea sp. NEAU-A123]
MARETGKTPTAGGAGGEAITTPGELLAAPGYLARRLYQSYVALWTRAVDPVLTSPQFAVLTAVDTYPGVDQGSLASSVALDRSTMADIVRRLEDNGLIVRHTAPHDGRRKLLHLTEAGSRRLEEVSRRVRELDERLLKGYSTAERERVLREIAALAAQWEALMGDE